MQIVKGKQPNGYDIQDMSEAKIFIFWSLLEKKRKEQSKNTLVDGLTPVEYDCWVQLNRFVEENMPNFTEVHV